MTLVRGGNEQTLDDNETENMPTGLNRFIDIR